MTSKFETELQEVYQIIGSVNSSHDQARTVRHTQTYKISRIGTAFKESFGAKDWKRGTIPCDYSELNYINTHHSRSLATDVCREIDFIKNRMGLSILFVNNSNVVYDICAQMTIFHNHDLIDVGIGITPVQSFADKISREMLCFEQFVWDLEQRGVSNIDIPVLILGITA